MTQFYEGQQVLSRQSGVWGRVSEVGRDRVVVKYDDGSTVPYSPSGADVCLILPAKPAPSKGDAVEQPSHYIFPGGAEVVHITKHLPFLRGSAVKYAARAGRKNKATELEDLRKARQCLDLEIERVEAEQ